MFLGYQNNKIVLTANTREDLENTPCMTFDEIVETQDEYVLWGTDYILKADYEREKSAAEKQERKAELVAQLDALDLKTIRALRAIQAGQGTQADTDKLAELEAQAAQIREELKEL